MYNINLGHYEIPPYNEDSLRSIYHIRELEIYRMAYIEYSTQKNQHNQQQLDIMLSHDWPQHIWEYGNKNKYILYIYILVYIYISIYISTYIVYNVY